GPGLNRGGHCAANPRGPAGTAPAGTTTAATVQESPRCHHLPDSPRSASPPQNEQWPGVMTLARRSSAIIGLLKGGTGLAMSVPAGDTSSAVPSSAAEDAASTASEAPEVRAACDAANGA